MRIKTKDIDALVDRLGSMGIDDDFTSDAEIEPTKPFRFLDLPYELRLCVYELLLVFPKTVDLDPSNYRAVKPCLNLFYVNRHIYKEATRAFYSRNTFRVFPIHGRFFHAKYPLLARLPAKYRAHITKLELRLGPGWTKPPKCWVINNKLGLADAVNIRQLRVFVECDPASHDVFEGFRVGEDFYTEFCLDLLRNLVTQAPGINEIEFDAYPSVSKSSPLLQGLVDEAKAKNIAITWGPERGWEKIVDIDLVNVLQKMGLDAGGLLKLP